MRCPSDGRSSGELQISSPWAAAAYFNRADTASDSFVMDEERTWLRTGDVATIDPNGFVRIVDRAKDLIKSGGEWISSQALELQLMNHPDIREAAVIGRPDPKWQERPVACVVLQRDTPEARAHFEEQFRPYLARFFSKWQIPEEVLFWNELPKGKTGKIDKIVLRKNTSADLPFGSANYAPPS
jgi:fatty-acyl-CoA synthase